MTEPEVVEDFFGVYLLYCLNPKYKGRTYIGYTREPNRRIMQHNRGTWAGGAYRTSNKGPWKMVLIVHGFPNNISALRFEWAWQNPTKTTRLQHLYLKKIPRQESEFQFKLRVLSEMLRVGPWCRLPLLIRWLEKEYFEEFPVTRKPPEHMKICYGPVKIKNLKKIDNVGYEDKSEECIICCRLIKSYQSKIKCLNQFCVLVCHISCLADRFLEPGEYIPIQGSCPLCDIKLKWGDLIRKIKGCSLDLNGDCGVTDETLSGNDEVIPSNVADEIDDEQPSWFLDCKEDL
ncbi:structure-specific endonuclease subunit SLX1 homolog [Bombyx mandarina]|uniref:Structure-specific endonuclease subunit SLX1 homolog n=3 Tax=Bombyx TaxID=7090 RepID=A0A8R2M1N7_BOMMO|nr:structure-specific endonuclease subunit SLX1 homolog [Bombyx mandarina]XP_037872410.1 structure-specific endonuclease subunit SLX1 homolog isoform X1 [Bombyx mori]XP_037872411.1 structure-specific endonuclease subunit SLX1 homolog isoform X1 [Bombyx mori]